MQLHLFYYKRMEEIKNENKSQKQKQHFQVLKQLTRIIATEVFMLLPLPSFPGPEAASVRFPSRQFLMEAAWCGEEAAARDPMLALSPTRVNSGKLLSSPSRHLKIRGNHSTCIIGFVSGLS